MTVNVQVGSPLLTPDRRVCRGYLLAVGKGDRRWGQVHFRRVVAVLGSFGDDHISCKVAVWLS